MRQQDSFQWIESCGSAGSFSTHRRRGHVIVIAPGEVFEEGLVEIIHRAFRVGEVVGGDGEDVFAELEFVFPVSDSAVFFRL